MTTTRILIQKDAKNLVPADVTSAQRTVWAQNFTIYDVNADGTKSAPIGPTVVGGSGSMARTQAQIDAGPTSADIAIFQGVFYLDTDPTQKYVVNAAGTAYVTQGNGSGAFSGITGQPTDNANLSTALNAKINIAPGWDGTTPALASGVNPITAGFASNAFVFTGAGTSPALDGQTGIAGDTFIFGFGGSSTWTKFAARTGVPVAFATGHTFVDADDTAHVIATGTPAYTLPTGRAPGWGVSIDGAFTLTGGLTIGSGVTDLRVTTGTAFCSVVQTDTSGAGATYKLVGTK